MLSSGRSGWLRSDSHRQCQAWWNSCTSAEERSQRTINNRDLDIVFLQFECLCDLSICDFLGGRFGCQRGQGQEAELSNDLIRFQG